MCLRTLMTYVIIIPHYLCKEEISPCYFFLLGGGGGGVLLSSSSILFQVLQILVEPRGEGFWNHKVIKNRKSTTSLQYHVIM